MSDRPLDVLEASLGVAVSVQLKDDTTYSGTLAGYDQHMNLVLEDVETDEEGGEDTIVIRGDNVVTITP